MREFYKKYKILIIAILIAALLWLYVNYQEGNLRGSFNFSNQQFVLEIEYQDLSEDFTVFDVSDQTVIIKPEGYRFFNTYSKNDFKAYIDLENAQKGDNIRLVKINSPQGVKINSIEPEIIRITLEKNEN